MVLDTAIRIKWPPQKIHWQESFRMTKQTISYCLYAPVHNIHFTLNSMEKDCTIVVKKKKKKKKKANRFFTEILSSVAVGLI